MASVVCATLKCRPLEVSDPLLCSLLFSSSCSAMSESVLGSTFCVWERVTLPSASLGRTTVGGVAWFCGVPLCVVPCGACGVTGGAKHGGNGGGGPVGGGGAGAPSESEKAGESLRGAVGVMAGWL